MQRHYEACLRHRIKLFGNIAKPCILLLTRDSADLFGVEVAYYQLKKTFSVMSGKLYNPIVRQETDKKGCANHNVLHEGSALAVDLIEFAC